MQCPACGADDSECWKFCESCGAELQADSATSPTDPRTSELTPPPVLGARCRCGAGPEMRDALGYCSVCGLKVTAASKPASPDDHREIALAPHFAAVTDRGHRHPTNQDNMAAALEDTNGERVYVIVVCDGLSSSCAAEAASETASKAACDGLVAASLDPVADLKAAMAKTIMTAHEAVCNVPFTSHPDKDGPATTIVAAIVRSGIATIGWVGDSRAYMLAPEGAALISHDHSWVNEVVDAGEMSLADAMASPESHVITQCLGPATNDDGSPADPPEPSVTVAQMPATGTLLLCSDGLWNFLPEPEDISAKVSELNAGQDALAIARHLVQHANSCGGRDNITVAALCVGS